MTTTVTITGTGNPRPSARRAGPGVLIESAGLALQFDAGRSTVQRLAQIGVAMAGLDAVFVTHHHSDHLTGLPDIVLTRWVLDGTDEVPPLSVVCPAGPAATFVERMLDPWTDDLAVRAAHTGRTSRPRCDVVDFDSTVAGAIVWQRDGVTVRAAEVRHEPVTPAVGYRVETPDGVVVISGDTMVCDEVADLANGADVLVHEAMLFEEIEKRPPEGHFVMDYHADTRLLGRQAATLGIATLVLTHFVPEPSTPERRATYERHIRDGGFTGRLIVADDLDTVVLG